MKFKEFKKNVVRWAKDRKIIPNSTFDAQYIKLIEELGELALGIRKQDKKVIKDRKGYLKKDGIFVKEEDIKNKGEN